MTDKFWIYSWGLVGISGKDIKALFKEPYQLFSLLMRQLGSNLKKLLQVVSYNNFY